MTARDNKRLTVKQLLTACGLGTPPDRVKLVKHVDHLDRDIRHIIAEGLFDVYQAEQSPTTRPFDKCDALASFIGLENNQAEFFGAYSVDGVRAFTAGDLAKFPDYLADAHRDGNRRIWYELSELEGFQFLRGRLIVQWASTRGWFQKKDLDVYELRPPIRAMPFPGYTDVILSWGELRRIFDHARAHSDWKAALQANAGIYRIVDLESGRIYIGSAYGEAGIWGR